VQTTHNTVLITGGTSGIGLALAKRFLSEGNIVIITGTNGEKAEIVKSQLPTVVIELADMRDRQALDQLASRYPDVNILVNNAGVQYNYDFAADVSGQPLGKLRVTASVSFGLKCIVPLLPQFEALYPDLTIDLLLTDAVVNLFADRIDVAVRLGLLADSTLIAQQLMKTHYYVCASPAYLKCFGKPDHPIEMEHHNCLLFPLAGFRSRWIFKDCNGDLSEVAVSGRTVISSAIALQQCAIAGMGLALLPNWLIEDDIRVGTLVNVFSDYAVTATDFNTAAWLVYPSRAYVPLKVRVFIDFLKHSIGIMLRTPSFPWDES
jgi:DNA-binding transcriptional LysR family regulator